MRYFPSATAPRLAAIAGGRFRGAARIPAEAGRRGGRRARIRSRAALRGAARRRGGAGAVQLESLDLRSRLDGASARSPASGPSWRGARALGGGAPGLAIAASARRARGGARGQATRIRLAALREAAELTARLADLGATTPTAGATGCSMPSRTRSTGLRATGTGRRRSRRGARRGAGAPPPRRQGLAECGAAPGKRRRRPLRGLLSARPLRGRGELDRRHRRHLDQALLRGESAHRRRPQRAGRPAARSSRSAATSTSRSAPTATTRSSSTSTDRRGSASSSAHGRRPHR